MAVVYTPLVRKTEQVHLRVGPEDKRDIEAEARRLGLSVSSYLLYLHRRHMEERNRVPSPRPDEAP